MPDMGEDQARVLGAVPNIVNRYALVLPIILNILNNPLLSISRCYT